MKFGGTSVADPDAINRLIAIVRQQQTKTGSAPLVVVSALAKVTDSLVRIAQLAEDGAATAAAAGGDRAAGRSRRAHRGGGGSANAARASSACGGRGAQRQPRTAARGDYAGV